jgi:hypothetical protein
MEGSWSRTMPSSIPEMPDMIALIFNHCELTGCGSGISANSRCRAWDVSECLRTFDFKRSQTSLPRLKFAVRAFIMFPHRSWTSGPYVLGVTLYDIWFNRRSLLRHKCEFLSLRSTGEGCERFHAPRQLDNNSGIPHHSGVGPFNCVQWVFVV